MKFNTNLLGREGFSAPLREIHEIEFSSRCNLACKYCPHPKMARAKADMSQETFDATIAHLSHLVMVGTQGEVSLTGIGEAILHDRFIPWMQAIRGVIGWNRKLVVATNGVALTRDIALAMAEQKAIVYVSTHRPEKAGPAVEMLKSVGCSFGTNTAFVDSAMDWAGQVQWFTSMEASMCSYLQKRWGAVRQDGSVNTCCMDAESKYPLGSVYDEPGSLRVWATSLCANCNLVAPKEYRRDGVWPIDLVEFTNARDRAKQMVA